MTVIVAHFSEGSMFWEPHIQKRCFDSCFDLSSFYFTLIFIFSIIWSYCIYNIIQPIFWTLHSFLLVLICTVCIRYNSLKDMFTMSIWTHSTNNNRSITNSTNIRLQLSKLVTWSSNKVAAFFIQNPCFCYHCSTWKHKEVI